MEWSRYESTATKNRKRQQKPKGKETTSAIGIYFFLIILAGTPPAITLEGMSLVTTEPAAIIDPFPIVVPAVNTEPAPIHTSSSMIISESK